MVYYIGHFNIEDLIYPHYTKLGTAGGACLYAAMGGWLWNREASVISRIGGEYPQDYLDILDSLGIRRYLTVIPGETMASVTEYASGHDRCFRMKNRPEKLFELTPTAEDVERAQVEEGSFAHIGPLNLGLLEDMVELLRAKNCTVSVDTCDSFVREDPQRLISILRKTELFLPSRSELMSFDSGGRTLLEQADWLSDATGHSVIVKDSTNGSYVPQGGGYVRVPVYEGAKSVDLTGAGDSYCGALMAQYSRGYTLRDCAICASVSASLAIEGCGALHYHGVSDGEREKRYAYIINKMEDRN